MFPKVSETSLTTRDHVEPSLIIPVSLDQKFLSVVEFIQVVRDRHHLMMDVSNPSRFPLLSKFLMKM